MLNTISSDATHWLTLIPDHSTNTAFSLSVFQTKTGLALLYDDDTNNTYDIRLKLTKEMLIIQKQDVVCIGSSAHHLNVSTKAYPHKGFNLSDANLSDAKASLDGC